MTEFLVGETGKARMKTVQMVGRVGRGPGRSLQDLVGFLSEIHAAGVDLFLHQQGIDTTSPGGKAMFQMLGVFAEFERGQEATHPLLGDELRALRELKRQSAAPFVFASERGGPFTPSGFAKLLAD